MQHFSFCDQLFHRAGYVFNWHVRIDPVLVIQIDAVGSEALQGFLNHFPDVLRSAVKNKTALFIVEAKFGCDSDSVADRRERLSDKLFVCVGTVKFGCIAALLRPFRIRLVTSQAFLSLRKETLHECAFGEEALLAPEATSTSAASGLLFHTVTVCPAFKRLAAIREPIAPRPRNPILLISTPSSTCRTSRSASLQASPFDGDLAKMRAAGLVTEGV